MPKEYITTDETRTGEMPAWSAFRVDWSRGGYVQVASVGNEVPPESLSGDNGWFVDLDRERINELIRVLRKARDQVYGRDE